MLESPHQRGCRPQVQARLLEGQSFKDKPGLGGRQWERHELPGKRAPKEWIETPKVLGPGVSQSVLIAGKSIRPEVRS
jgi:hypothetical protein